MKSLSQSGGGTLSVLMEQHIVSYSIHNCSAQRHVCMNEGTFSIHLLFHLFFYNLGSRKWFLTSSKVLLKNKLLVGFLLACCGLIVWLGPSFLTSLITSQRSKIFTLAPEGSKIGI